MITVMLFALGVYLEMNPRDDLYYLVRVLPPDFLLLLKDLMRERPGIESGLRQRVAAPSRAAWLIVLAPLFLLLVIAWQTPWRPPFDGRFRFVDRKALNIERGRGILVGQQQALLVDGLVQLIQDNS